MNLKNIANSIINMLGGRETVAKNIEDLAKGLEGQLQKALDNTHDAPQDTAEEAPQATAPAGTPQHASLTIGGHTYTFRKTSDTTALVTFTHVPASVGEFRQLYTDLLGKSEYAVPALIPMAMEVYARNQQEGEQCIATFCTFAARGEMTRILKDKFSRPSDPYCQRYLPAALLQGATPQNAYTPSRPYTVSIGHAANQDEDSGMYNARYHYLHILGAGWDTQQRGVQVVRADGADLFQVNGCPATYTSCKPIRGTWPGLE